MQRTIFRLFLVMLLSVLLITAACNSNDDDDDNDSVEADDDVTDDDAGDDDAIDDDNDVTDDDVADDDVADDDVTDDDVTDDDVVDDDSTDDDTGDDDTVVDCNAVITRTPYLQNAATDGMTVMWQTNKKGNTIVQYGATEALGQQVVNNELTRTHEIRITGLEPETKYYYKAISCEDESAVTTMTTAPLTDTPFTFAAYGDNRSYPEQHRLVVESMIDAAPDFIITVGDIIEDGWVPGQYDSQFFQPLADLIDHTPIYISIGNHEAESAFYYTSFSFPEDNSAYSFTYGNTFFIGFNSNRPYTPAWWQYAWLEQQLDSAEAEAAEFIIVYCHHPA